MPSRKINPNDWSLHQPVGYTSDPDQRVGLKNKHLRALKLVPGVPTQREVCARSFSFAERPILRFTVAASIVWTADAVVSHGPTPLPPLVKCSACSRMVRNES